MLAIDPSSPFTGGAILGDRVRMQDHATDPGVFIRSMATRGHLGGLSLATPEAARLLDAIGRPWTLIETVGVGQVEVEIAGKADTTVVVVNPGWGDSVQANKAGLMEIADIFVINKADRKGVADTRRDLEQMLELSDLDDDAWHPPILPVIATTNEGVAEYWAAVVAHRCGDRSVRRARPPSPVPCRRRAPRDRRPSPRATRPRTDHRRAMGPAASSTSPNTASTPGPPPTRCSKASTAMPAPVRTRRSTRTTDVGPFGDDQRSVARMSSIRSRSLHHRSTTSHPSRRTLRFRAVS